MNIIFANNKNEIVSLVDSGKILRKSVHRQLLVFPSARYESGMETAGRVSVCCSSCA